MRCVRTSDRTASASRSSASWPLGKSFSCRASAARACPPSPRPKADRAVSRSVLSAARELAGEPFDDAGGLGDRRSAGAVATTVASRGSVGATPWPEGRARQGRSAREPVGAYRARRRCRRRIRGANDGTREGASPVARPPGDLRRGGADPGVSCPPPAAPGSKSPPKVRATRPSTRAFASSGAKTAALSTSSASRRSRIERLRVVASHAPPRCSRRKVAVNSSRATRKREYAVLSGIPEGLGDLGHRARVELVQDEHSAPHEIDRLECPRDEHAQLARGDHVVGGRDQRAVPAGSS